MGWTLDNPRMFSSDAACAIGLPAAILLQQIKFTVDHHAGGKIVDGFKWVYNTYEGWQEMLPFYDRKTIIRAILLLEELGLIKSRNDLNKVGFDRTKWYAVDEVAILKFKSTIGTNSTHPSGHSDPIHQDIVPLTIPESITESITEKLGKPQNEGEAAMPVIDTKGKSAKEILEGVGKFYQDKKKEKQLLPIKSPKGLFTFWWDECSNLYEDMKVRPTWKALYGGQFKTLMEYTYNAQVPLKDFIHTCISDWGNLKDTIASQAGVKTPPSRPNHAWLLTHLTIAINWYQKKLLSKVPVQKVKEPTLQLTAKMKQTSTPEQFMASLHELGKD
jgi:hypothetical protein